MKSLVITNVALLFLFGSVSGCRSESGGEQRSIETFTHSANPTVGSLGLSSEYENRNGEYDQAIKLAERAFKKDPDDIDIRVRYAEALENKLVHQAEKNPQLFNNCVKEWLAILRNEGGDERGQTLSGIGLPLSGQLFGDEDRVVPARRHLQSLCGVLPKAWETDKHYLRRVLVHYTVKAELRSASGQARQNHSGNGPSESGSEK